MKDKRSAHLVRPPEFYNEPGNSLGYLTRITFRSFSRQLERRTLPFGVSAGQWPFLRQLWMEEGLTQRELSRRVAMQEPTTVSALNSMEKAGLVRREPSTSDRRKTHVFLTARARELRAELMICVADVNEIASWGIDPAEIDILRRVLAKMIGNLARDDDMSESAPEEVAVAVPG